MRNSLFCCRFKTNPPRQEADRRSKSKHSPENSSEIDAMAWAVKWWMPLSVTQVALWWTLLSLDQSGVAVAGATNSVNARQSEAVTVSLFFPPPHPTLLTPPPLPKGILFSPQFRSHQETEMAAQSNWMIDIYDMVVSRKNRGLYSLACRKWSDHNSISGNERKGACPF